MTIVWFAVVAVALVVIVAAVRMRRGGPGPAVNWVPKKFRGSLNSVYRKRGWTAPYDDNGEKTSTR